MGLVRGLGKLTDPGGGGRDDGPRGEVCGGIGRRRASAVHSPPRRRLEEWSGGED